MSEQPKTLTNSEVNFLYKQNGGKYQVSTDVTAEYLVATDSDGGWIKNNIRTGRSK